MSTANNTAMRDICAMLDRIQTEAYAAGRADEREESAKLLEALKELYATVRGECPSLLNEDSGGSARLDMLISAVLAAYECKGVDSGGTGAREGATK